jgi:putative N6-adenine-specific DNA methylase
MQETLAAAVVLTTGWQGAENFINPMCGSGTLAIEAALIGLKRAPGLTRRNFGFMHVIGYHELRWRNMREQARASAARKLAGRIIATDHDSAAIEAAKKNAATAGVDHVIEFRACDYADTPVPPGGGVIVVNPEYGERMGEVQQLVPVYGGIGDFLKQKGAGYRGFVFTGNPMLAKKVGLKARRTFPFSNSGIECRLLEYELYQGTRKKTKGRQEQDAGS